MAHIPAQRTWIESIGRSDPLLTVMAAVAICAGIWLRLRGLAALPLASDEYYIARSVENILRSGVPEYLCGGYYTRGLLFQYAVAALHLGGMPILTAARLLAVIGSLAVLPAAFLIGARLQGRVLGLLVVIFLALSAWEIDLAGFGRMYAPFQAVFMWYAVFFLRFAVDRDNRAAVPMAVLTIVGVLTWEGGVLIALANLLPPLLNYRTHGLSRRDGLYLAVAVALALACAWFVTTDFRLIDAKLFPADLDTEGVSATPSGWQKPGTVDWHALLHSPRWLVLAAVALATVGFATQRLWERYRAYWLTALALFATLAAVVVHQFGAAALIVALLLASGLANGRELLGERARPIQIAVASCALFWLLYGFFGARWIQGADMGMVNGSRPLLVAYNLFRIPDFYYEIIWPWYHAAPRMGLALAALLVLAVVRAARPGVSAQERAALTLVICMLAGAAASNPPRHETRYVFFLYPLALLVAGASAARLFAAVMRTSAARNSGTRQSDAIAAPVPNFNSQLGMARPIVALLMCGSAFALAEDSGLRTPAVIGDPESLGTHARPPRQLLFPAAGVAHRVARFDARGAADWLAQHTSPGTVTVNGVPGVDYFYRRFDSAYIDSAQQRFIGYSCDAGRRERWGNLPLSYDLRTLQSRLAPAPRALLVLDAREAATLLPKLNATALSADSTKPAHLVWSSAGGAVVIAELGRETPSASTN